MDIKLLTDKPDISSFLKIDNFELDDNAYGYIYKIRNKENNKIYIGKTKNLFRRANEYISKSSDNKILKGFHKTIVDIGIDKFTMEPIAKAYNKYNLAALELSYINKYDARNPKVGYNKSLESVITPTSLSNYKIRPQYAKERMSRSKLITAINPKLKMIYFSTGLLLFGKIINRGKDEVKSAARRCASLDDYYIYYMNKDDYKSQINFLERYYEKRDYSIGLISDIKSFVNYRKYIDEYILYGKNPEDYDIRFIRQSDNELGYEYDDIKIIVDYCKNMIK